MVKYVSTHTRGTQKKSAKDLSNDAYAMFFFFFFFWGGGGRLLCVCFFSDFLIKAYVVGTHLNCRCNSNGYPQHMPL